MPLISFAFTLPATELAWFWLLLQLALVCTAVYAGVLDSIPGQLGVVGLVVTWPVQLGHIYRGFRSGVSIENALQEALGENYRDAIPAERRVHLCGNGAASDWLQPFSMGRAEVERIKNIAYGEAGTRHTLDIYRPTHVPEGGCPVVLQIHGGGWVTGQKDNQALPLMYYLASKGWVCVAINYRLSPGVSFPGHLEDCNAALCWVRTKGREYGMAADFVAVTGGSAGGHLSALMAVSANNPKLQVGFEQFDSRVQACVPLYGVYDFRPGSGNLIGREPGTKFLTEKVLKSTPEEEPELWRQASPITQVHDAVPPFFLLHGDRDSLASVGESRNFFRRLQEASNKPIAYAELRGAEHGFDMLHSPRVEQVIRGIHRFLEWSYASWQAEKDS